MKYLLYISIIGCIILCAGCRPGHDPRLAEADRLMEESPDSAYSILESIDTLGLHSSDRPYYALLYTQACIKNDVGIASDSLIAKAYGTYGTHPDGNLGIRAAFYMGEVNYNGKHRRDAMKYYLQAYERSNSSDDSYWKAKSAERIGDLFFYNYYYPEAETYYREAVEGYRDAGRQINHRWALGMLGVLYINENKWTEAEQLFDSLESVCAEDTPENQGIRDFIMRAKMDIPGGVEGSVKAKAVSFDPFSTAVSPTEKIDLAVWKSDIMLKTGKPDSARMEVNAALPYCATVQDKAILYHTLYRICKAAVPSGEWQVVDSLLHYEGLLATELLKNSAMGAKSDFYVYQTNVNKIEADANGQKYHIVLWMTVILVAVSILVIFLLIKIYRQRIQLKTTELEARIESFAELSRNYSELEAENERLSDSVTGLVNSAEEEGRNMAMLSDIAEKNSELIGSLRNEKELLFRQKWETLNTLCHGYFEWYDNEKTRGMILKSIAKEVDRLKSANSYKEIENSVDMNMNGIAGRLREQCHFLSEKEFRFIILVFAGLSARSVCLIMDIKYRNFYNIKSRLAKRIADSGAPEKEDFLKYLQIKISGNN